MKVRSVERLQDIIDADLGWRRQEMTIFRSQVEKSESLVQRSLLRASVALLYAHWEGYIKNSIHAFRCYLAHQRPSYDILRPEVAAMAMRNRLDMLSSSNRSKVHTEVIIKIREESSSRATISTSKDKVDTGSNLNYRRLEDLLTSIGCDCDRYAEHEDLIDAELLGARNGIVHGEDDYIRLSEWDDLRGIIFGIMIDISSQIMNSAQQKLYLLEGARPSALSDGFS